MDAESESLKIEIETALDTETSPHAIALLQAVQRRVGYLPLEAIEAIADKLALASAEVYGVATFYNQFRFVPPGKRHVQVCMGTACHIKGGGAISDEWQRRLEISDGEVTADRSYSLEHVACVGCCALAPVTVVGGEVHGHISPASVSDLMIRHRLQDQQELADDKSGEVK